MASAALSDTDVAALQALVRRCRSAGGEYAYP